MNAFKQFWIQYADFSSKTSRAHFWLAFFWNSLISLPLWVFYIVTSLSHQNAQETLNFSTVHSKTGLWALAFLAFFYFLILVPQSSHLCTSLAGCGNPLVLDLFEPWTGSALFVDGARYFPISLGDYSYFSLDSHDASREKHLPTTSRNSYGSGF